MRKILCASVMALAPLCCVNAVAYAQSFYFGVQGGLNIAHDGEFANSGVDLKLDAGYAIGAMIGYDFGNQVRVEGELTYRANDMDTLGVLPVSGDMTSTAFMANVFYDFSTAGNWAPYIGGGLGAANVTFTSAVEVDDTVLAYQFIGGIGYKLSPTVTLGFDYRYFGVDTPTFNAVPRFEQEYSNSTFMIGVRSSF